MNAYYNQDTELFFDGAFMKAADAKIDLYAQSLHYGYSVFEGIRSYSVNGEARIFKAKEHFERLHHSCKTVHIPLTYTCDELEAFTYEVLKRNNLKDAYIRPLVFCPANMNITKAAGSHLTIQVWEWAQGYLANNITIMTSSYQRPNPKAFHITAKIAGHYVNSIMASQEAKDKGFNEGMLLDENGNVAEASGANIFFEKDGVLYTPPTGYILPGITRATCINLAAELGIKVVEKFFKPEDMEGTDAAFFCGTAAEVVAITSLNNIPFTKNWDETNAAKIQNAYRLLIREEAYLTAQKTA